MGRRSSSKLKRSGRIEKGRGDGPAPALILRGLAPSVGWHRWAAAGLVALAAVGVYWNTLDNGFVSWDDRDYIYGNSLVLGDGGLGAIWFDVFEEKPQEQYYPLVFTSFWIEHKLVGIAKPPTESPQPLYHATQFLLHAGNAALLLFVLRWLGVGLFPSVVAAAFFAVHPTNVASVAWVTERKNTLSGFFMLLSLLLYLQNRHGTGRWRFVLAIVCFQMALFSKTAALMLAPVLLVTDRVLDGRWTWASVKRSVPFFALGFVAAALTMSIETAQARSGEPIALGLRPLVAASAVIHYLAKLVVPVDLLPLYPRWPESFAVLPYWVCLFVVLGAILLLWRYRRWFGALVMWGLAVFILLLFPMLGFRHFNYMQYAFVADHYLYLSGPGVFLVIGILLDRLRRAGIAGQGGHRTRTWLVYGLLGGALVTCGVLTVRYNPAWRTGVSFWEYTLSGNPDCFAGNFNLGNHYRRAGRLDRAVDYYREASRIAPNYIRSRLFSARCSRKLDRDEDAVGYYEAAIDAAARKGQRALQIRNEFAAFLQSIGRPREALRQFETVIEMEGRSTGQRKYTPAAETAASRIREQLGGGP